MRNITLAFLLILSVTACEKVPVVEAKIDGDGLTPLTMYQNPGDPPREWTIEDDWHRVFMAVRVGPERLYFYVRTHAEPSTTPPSMWWSKGAHLMTLGVSTDCNSSLQYFDNPANSFANNFLKVLYPEVYPHSPETGEPDLAAILIVEDCLDSDIEVLITVIDDLGEPAREHRLTIRAVQVDWYYNPQIPYLSG